jgi:penicillin-binding protein 1A
MDSLIERQIVDNKVFSDIDRAPMALGSLTEGLTPVEMAGGYQVFANGGTFTEPYAYYEVRDAEDKIVLKPNTQPLQVISPETATVMNNLLQGVTTAGTGPGGRLANMPTGGKTGTSTDDVDQWFIGFTPYYVCQVWLGYDSKTADNEYGRIRYSSYAPPLIFRDIMTSLHEGLEYKEFYASPEVESMIYCTATGNLASPGCTETATGWYKTSRKPSMCTGIHLPPEEEEDEDAPPEEDADPDAPRQINTASSTDSSDDEAPQEIT